MHTITKENLVDMAGGIIEGFDLSGMDLSGVVLPGTTFRYCKMNNTVLKNSGLKNAGFEYCALNLADLSWADMRETRFDYCQAEGALFENSMMDMAVMTFSSVESAVFRNASLRGSLFYQLNAVLADFRGADIYSLHWSHVTLDGAKLGKVRGVFANREAVYELLRREVPEDLDHAGIIGSIRVLKQWCWPRWREEYRKLEPGVQKWIKDRFSQYTESGLKEALEGDLDVEIS